MSNRKHRQLAPTVVELCAQVWPRCFAVYQQRRRPLKVGIHHDIRTLVGDELDRKLLTAALRLYTGNPFYLRALIEPGAVRVDLSGNPVGEVSPEDQQQARERFAMVMARISRRRINK